MEGVYIGKSRGGPWASLSALLVTASVAAAIFRGPSWVYALSGVGALFALIGLILSGLAPSLEKPVVFPSVMLGVHALLFVVGAVLQSMFLSPLPEDSRKIPHLQTRYVDPSGLFELKGPDGWDFRPAPSSLETGVRMQPSDQTRYMGVSEANLFVRRLDTTPKSAAEFLKTAAASFSEKHSEKKLFELKTEKGVSLSGAPVMWSELTIKRFWVPLYQVSVFGVKNGRYLCSVSATGLKNHADLSRLLCLGLFERIKITDKPGS
jgi:hypothetical protein